ncbi:MAG: orotate phosphoribosyltransferase [Ignavibacteriaceae bacterium]|jgi:orotate phosphoribosyltransferase|nr:orotate phosphoribosyltransferase [Ignavibacteriaceae bacterium]
MNLNKDDVLRIFKGTEALLEGHFLLTSGRHSSQYFQCAKVLQYPEYTSQICSLIAEHFKSYEIDTVVAPAMGGIIVGYEVAKLLNKRSIFTERENKMMTLRRGFTLSKGEKVLVCEDVVTTGGSVFEVIDIVKQFGAEVVGIGSIVDRSNGKVNFGYDFFPALSLEVVSYLPEECEICKEGKLKLVKPGSRQVF